MNEPASTDNKSAATQEDRRTAAGHYIVLSTALMSVAMAITGAGVGLIAFVMNERMPSCWFFIFSVSGLIFLILSVVAGGSGINKLAEDGYKGNWSLETGSGKFSVQGFLGILGIVLFLVASLMSGSPSRKLADTPKTMNDVALAELQASLATLHSELRTHRLSIERRGYEQRLQCWSCSIRKQSHAPSWGIDDGGNTCWYEHYEEE